MTEADLAHGGVEMGTAPPAQASVQSAADAENPLRSCTPIGADVGLRNVLTLAPASADYPVAESKTLHDDQIKTQYATLASVPDVAPKSQTIIANRLRQAVHDLAQDAVLYATSFEGPLLALEDLHYPHRSLADCIEENAALDSWLLPAAQRALATAAADAGIPVVSVSAKYSTRQCHSCQNFTRVNGRTIRCPVEDCPVEEVCRDRSAAVTIARRVL